ncbi:MAG: methyltransferase family protein [Halapricum sp.]
MSTTLLAIGLTGAALQLVLTGRAASDAGRQPWPPEEVSGRFGLYWLLVMAMAGSFFGSLATTAGSLYPVGIVSIIGGGAFLLGAAINVLTADEFEGPEEILGLEWHHHTDGPFRFSRNPEVLGHAGAVAGLAIAAGSWQAMVLAAVIVGWFAVRPFAEEPVLADRYGDRYERYRSRVDRYLDRTRLSEAFGSCRNDCSG